MYTNAPGIARAFAKKQPVRGRNIHKSVTPAELNFRGRRAILIYIALDGAAHPSQEVSLLKTKKLLFILNPRTVGLVPPGPGIDDKEQLLQLHGRYLLTRWTHPSKTMGNSIARRSADCNSANLAAVQKISGSAGSAGAFLEKDLAILPLFVYNTALQEESYKNNKPSARLLNN